MKSDVTNVQYYNVHYKDQRFPVVYQKIPTGTRSGVSASTGEGLVHVSGMPLLFPLLFSFLLCTVINSVQQQYRFFAKLHN
jgi:hypothetical protein